MNETAPEGQVYVCSACGKRSKDRHGDKPISKGWDVSCMLHAVLCFEDKLVLNQGVVTQIEKGGVVETASAQ